MKEPLPVIPVPLMQPDNDSILDLGKAMKDLYEQRRFEKSIDYGEKPPPPAFSEADLAWMKGLGCLSR